MCINVNICMGLIVKCLACCFKCSNASKALDVAGLKNFTNTLSLIFIKIVMTLFSNLECVCYVVHVVRVVHSSKGFPCLLSQKSKAVCL